MKKILTYVILSIILALNLVGCNSSTEKSDKLSIAIWDKGQEAGILSILDDFTKETGIETELQVITWDSYWTLLEAGASGGDMPDVFWMHPNQAQKYISNDILLEIKSDSINWDKFKKDILEIYTSNNKIYSVPKDIDTIALWYNKTMFDEANIPYPDETWTYEKYYEVAKQLTKDDGSQYGIAMNPTNDQDSYYNIVYAMGGNIISDDKTKSGFDNPKTIKAFEFIQKLINDTMPPVNVMSETGIDTLFSSGKVAMITQGSWMVSPFKENEYITKNCDVAIIPKSSDGKRVSMYNGLGWAIYANTKNPENALKLVEWFGSEQMQKKQADLGVTMSAYEGVSSNWANSAEFNLQAYLDVLNSSDAQLIIKPYSKDTLSWENIMHQTLKELWSNTKTANEVCNEISIKMNEILNAENS